MKRYTLLILACILFLTSCSKKEEPPIIIESKTKLSFYWQGNDTNNASILKVNNTFSGMQSKFYMTGVFGNWENPDFEQFITEQLKEGMQIDLVQMYPEWFERILKNQEEHLFIDLNSISSDILDLSPFPEEVKEYCTVNGELIGLPYVTSIPLFYWHTDVFKKTNVAIPTNLEELLASGEKMQEAISDAYYPLAMDKEGRILFLITYLEQTTGKKWTTIDDFPYNKEELKSALSLLKELETRHVMPTLEEMGDSFELAENDNWLFAKYGGVYTWSSTAETYKKMLQNSDSFRPGYDFESMGDHDLIYYQIDRLLSITKASSYKEEIATYLNYLLHDAEMVKVMGELVPIFASEKANQIGVKKNYFPKEIQKLHKELNKKELHLIKDVIKEDISEPYTGMVEIITGISNGTYGVEQASQKMMEIVE